MKIDLTIHYTARAEEGETTADEVAALDRLNPLVMRLAEQVMEGAQAEGLDVKVTRKESA